VRPAPLYTAPKRPLPCSAGSCRKAYANPDAGRARYFSIGGRLTSMTINQKIGDKDATIAGGGLELRFRGRGHFGLEASLDFLHGDFTLNGPLARDSLPFALSAMIYLRPNSDANIFNMYLLGGVGIIGTTMTLVDQTNTQVKQDFTEYELHAGVGAELRFHWFALRADVRGLALFRDDSSGAGQFYAGVDGAPVPSQSYAVVGTLGAALWF
jgi:hypothetical protein